MFITILIFQNNLYSSTSIKNIEDFGIISLMYHRFEENKYPSTNIKIKDFKEHIKIIQASDIHFVNPNNFEDELSKISYISDPKNISWPRVLEINGKYIYIEEKPNKVATISLGHDEVLFGITDN